MSWQKDKWSIGLGGGYLLNVQYDITGIEKPSRICESMEKNMGTEQPAVTAHRGLQKNKDRNS